MLLFMSVLPVSQHVQAQEVRDSVRIYFRQGRSELDMSVRNNRAALGRIADSLSTSYADSVYILRKILVEGGGNCRRNVRKLCSGTWRNMANCPTR